MVLCSGVERRSLPTGSAPRNDGRTYTLARIDDGKELQPYVPPPIEAEATASIGNLPNWADCASDG